MQKHSKYKYTYYQNTHKYTHPHITKLIHTHTHAHTHTYTHIHTHTHIHIQTYTYTHTHHILQNKLKHLFETQIIKQKAHNFYFTQYWGLGINLQNSTNVAVIMLCDRNTGNNFNITNKSLKKPCQNPMLACLIALIGYFVLK